MCHNKYVKNEKRMENAFACRMVKVISEDIKRVCCL